MNYPFRSIAVIVSLSLVAALNAGCASEEGGNIDEGTQDIVHSQGLLGDVSAVKTVRGQVIDADSKVAELLNLARLDASAPPPSPGVLRCGVGPDDAFDMTFLNGRGEVAGKLVPCAGGNETSIAGTLTIGSKNYIVRDIRLTSIRALFGSASRSVSGTAGACSIVCGGAVSDCQTAPSASACNDQLFYDLGRGVPRCPHTFTFEPGGLCPGH